MSERGVGNVDFNETYIILRSYSLRLLKSFDVYYFNGTRVRSISNPEGILCLALLDAGHVITGGCDRILRIWDIATGICLRELDGHGGTICSVDTHDDGVIVSGDRIGAVIIWSKKDALEGREVRLASFTDPNGFSVVQMRLKVGKTFLVRCYPALQKSITVTKFLA